MASTTTRRPLPALIALLALLILAGFVWWRVFNRPAHEHAAQPCPTPSASIRLPAPSSVTVLVLNATHRRGLAGRARTALMSAGFASPQPAGNDRKYLDKIKGTALIRYGPAARAGARLVHYYLPDAAMKRIDTSSRTVVVSLGRTFRSVAAPRVVRRELARAHVAAGGAHPSAGNGCSSTGVSR